MGKRKVIWLLLWILSLAGISFYGGAVSYGLFYALLLLPIVSFAYLLCVYFRFRIYQEAESREMVCGQAMPYYFVLRNEDHFGFASVRVRMFPDFSYMENLEEETEYELLPGDEFIYRTHLICRYRGEYEVGVKEVILTDFFGIFRFRYPIIGTIRAIVRPKLVELHEIRGLSDIIVDLHRESRFGGSEPDVVVRDYVQGDSLKRIHWKASAREQIWKVRTDIGEEKNGVRMIFDTGRYSSKPGEYIPLESKMLELLLALGMFFAKRSVPVSAYYSHGEIRSCEVTGIRQFEDLYQKMSEVCFDEEEDPLLLMEGLREQGALAEARVVIGVFHKWDQTMMQAAEKILEEGPVFLAYVVTDEDLSRDFGPNTARKKIIAVPIDAELEEVL
ncbi:MAG: DUF58 domain-containing protein [Lachnospiraceae bacterium]|nr:DUF58 domain-containing protein [Lachnospiraceae bacterium]